MNMKEKIFAALIVVLLILGGFFYFFPKEQEGVQNPPPPPPTPANQINEVNVIQPVPNAVVTSPLRVQGEARGNWYFEANLPISIHDAMGKQIAVIGAQALGEWMTTDFVPFDAIIPFVAPATDTGFLKVSKDNPSGLPEHDKSIMIPIRFR